MKNLTFKAAMLNDSRTTVNRQSTDGQSQRHYKQTPLSKRWKVLMTLVFLFTFAIGNVWGTDYGPFTITANTSAENPIYGIASDDYVGGNGVQTFTIPKVGGTASKSASSNMTYMGATSGNYQYIKISSGTHFYIRTTAPTYIKSVSIMAARNSISGQTNGFSYKFKSAESYSTQDMLGYNNASVPSTPVSAVATGNETEFDLYSSSKEWIILSISVTLTAGGTTTTYDVTLNPGDGAYASAPSGWTADGSNIKKTVSAGALTIPEPTRAGYKLTGWKSGLTDVTLSAGKLSVTQDTTLTAQWAEADCKIYSLTGEIGSAEGTAGDYEVTASALILKNSNARIKLTPAGGETFKAGDVITISGFTGNAAKKLGVYVKNAAGSSNIATAEETNLGDGFASATLSADAEYVFLARKETTTMNVLTCEVHRSCAEGVAAGLAYATTEVAKTEGDAAFTNPLTNANGLVIAGYKSSNTAVATVATNGQVTVVGPGSATITANSAVQTKAGTLYAAGSASYTLTVAALPEYHVTYDLNGGTGDVSEGDHKAGVIFTLHDGVTGITAPGSKTFVNWKDQDDALFDGGVEYTMPAKDVTLTAQWAGDVYTVKFMDGETLLDTKVVEVGSNPTDIEHPTKQMFTFAAWQKEGVDIALDDESWTSVAKDAEITLTVRWAKAYANSVDFVKKITDDGTSGWAAYLEANNYYIASTEGVSFDNNNAFDTGLKMKTTIGNTLSFTAAAGKVIDLTVGNISGMTIAINGGEASAITSGTDATHLAVSHYYAAGEQEVVLTETVAGYNIIRQITIRDPYQVTFDANGGEDVASLNGTPSVTLPSATKGTDSFLGWFDAAEGGNKIGEAGASYTPTADIELFAHWEAVSTDARLASITFSATGTLSPAFDPEVTSYTYTMPYGTAAIPTITGATSVNAKAQDPIIGDAAAVWGEAQTVKGVAQSGDKKTYTITMAKAPKDGVCIVKADLAAGSSAASITATSGAYKDADNIAINVAKDLKLGSTGAYVKVAVKDTYFQDGDVVEIVLRTDKSASAWLQIFADEGTTLVAEMKSGVSNATPNHLTISGVPENTSALYLYRTEAADGDMNPYPTSMAVYRAMNPVLTAITIDERAGVIDPLDDKHFNVQIPYEADLANLTIVPTIAWNAPAAEGSIVVNNGGAWVEGNNTYKLTDKDGDYTVYTLTLTRDVLKHTVSFNTHGGSAVASVEVVDGQKLAAAPADPTKDENVFKFWSETEDGAEVDVTTVQINADKEFHAVWEAEPAGIKLINGDVVNHTNFLTGTNETTVEIESVEHKCVDFTTAGSNRTTVASISDLKEFIQYNATTNKAKIKLTLYNTKSSAVSAYLHMLEEGSETPTTEEISIPAGEVLKTDFYEFNSEKNRSFYITCGNRDYVKVLQVKVIDDGTTTLKKAGQVGYSVNTLKSRIFAPQQSAISFEGLTINANAVCKPLSTTAMKIKNAYNISFHADVDMTLAVTTEGNQTYYVSATADGTTNETSFTGRKEFEITAGDWYIHAGNSELKVAKLEFIAPKCEEPTVADMDDVDLCEGAAFTALAVSASVSDEGTLHYAWFKEAGETDEAVGTDQATYTPAADGQYYVIVTNHKDNFTDNSKTSNTITVEHFAAAVITTAPVDVMKEAGQSATLSVVASGKNCTYEWFACDDALGTNPVAFIPAETGTSLTVTVAGEKYYKVEVSSDCGAPVSAVAKVKEWTAYPQADVTGSITWDWTNAAWPAEGTASFKVVDGELDLLANQNSIVPVVDGVNGFRADMLLGSGQYVWRYGGADKKCFQGTELKFHTTVAGTVTLWYRSTSSGKDVKVYINGNDAGHHSTGNYTKSSTIVVPANSDVRITKEGETYVRINKIVFNANPDYTRPVSNNIGTLCVDHNVLAGGALGATFYQIASRNELYNDKIDFEEVLPNEELKAGEPYIFQSTTGKIELYYGETEADAPVAVRGMIGSFANTTLDITEENKSDILYIAQNKLWNCEDLVTSDLEVVANRAYIVMSEVPTYAEAHSNSNGAPRRRVTLGKDAEQVVTGVENLNASEQPVKMMIDGKLYILRGEKMFDATGRLVK